MEPLTELRGHFWDSKVGPIARTMGKPNIPQTALVFRRRRRAIKCDFSACFVDSSDYNAHAGIKGAFERVVGELKE